MRKNIKNQLLITCKSVNLTTVSDIEFYVRQGDLFLEYEPVVIGETQMLVEIPLTDAMKLTKGRANLQFAFKDAEGNHVATEIVEVPVGDFLKEAGYDPV